MANRIQLRRGGAQEWANANPTLAQGELGIELDTGRFKIGDGVSPWNTLRYERPVESTSNTANTLVQRDADGNFSAGTVTATLIGNASTAARLASSRQITLGGDLDGSAIFDGSTNITISADLDLVPTLPHYDGTNTSSATYTKVVVDSKGRITNASSPTSLSEYGLDGTVEGQSAQAYDLDLAAIAGLTTTGIISRTSGGNMQTRTITGTATRISISQGAGISGNPTIDMITTAVTAGDYNTESLTSVSGAGSNSEPFGTETVNATKFTVDAYGRLTSSTNVPIATATEGSKYAAYAGGTTYVRYDIIEDSSRVYQSITGIAAGGGAPTHTDASDAGGWRYLGAAATEQKGLASFAQEDFDVDANGHVTIAAVGVDNTQLQNNRIGFADGNTVENFELDQELTATTGYRGFNYLNYFKVNDTSGNLLVGANNTGDSGAGELDVNVRSYFSDPDITLDGDVNQTLDKTGDGNLFLQLTQNSATARTFSILSTNSGFGAANIVVAATDLVDIQASDAAGKVYVEDARFQDNYIATANATLNLDPGDDRAVAGTVRVWGNLQVDGTTTTVNSSTLQVDDPIITLGGDTAPVADDNLDRGIEFRYYDTEARLGFYGWDTNYTDLAGHGGGYSFLHAATNTAEVFTGTASGIIAGNVKLTSGTASSSNTTGDLVVAGGVGIAGAVNIGGLLDVDSTFRANSTSRFDDNMVIQGASKTLQINNGSGTTKIEFQSTTGNAIIGGVTDVTGNFNVNTNKFNVVAASGNTSIAGTLGVTNIATFSNNIDANGDVAIAGNIHSESTNDITTAKNSETGVWEIQSSDYGSLRVDGGAYVAGSALIDGTLHVNGAIEVKDSATEAESRLNWLRVRYRGRFGDSYQATPSYASHNTTTLRAHGGAGIERTLHVGGTGSGEGLFVGKRYNSDTVKFSVLGASGDTEIQGTLLVEDNVNFNGTLDVDADFAVRNGTTDKFFVDNLTGNTDIQGTLDVNGATEITNTLDVSNAVTFDQTLLVQGNSEFNGTVDVDANFAVRSGSTDKMTVASSSGNIATDGTLVVQGQTTINDSLIVDAANEVFSVRNGSAVEKFGVDADNGNTNIIGTLTVGDATQVNDTLGVSDVVTFTRNTEQTLTGSYAADGAFRLTGGAGIARNLAVGGDARVYGATELTGALDLNNNANISGTLLQGGGATFLSNVEILAGVGGATKFQVVSATGNTDIRGTLDIGGDVTAESNLTITGNLTVNGTTTTVNSTVTTLDDPIITVGGDTAPTTNDGKDRGVEFRYYDGSAKIGFFGYDRSANQFAFLTSASNSSEVLSGTDGPLRAGSLNLTGAGTSLDVDANANIDGTLTVDGQIISQVASGAALVIPNTTKINNLNADLLDSMTTASTATATTVVARDSSGDFAANIITVASGVGAAAGIQGNATTADALRTARTITVDGVVDGSVSFNGSADVTISTTYNDADITALAAMTGTGLVTRTADNTYARRTLAVTASSGITLTNADGVSGNPTINVASTASNSANNLVLRDASGDFAAGTITAALVGNVTGQTSDISNHDTDALSEGSTNLYFTNERVDDRIDALVQASTGITKVYDDTAGTYTLSVTQADVNTDNVTEGSTNLFTTAARTRTHFTYGVGVELSGAGALSVTQADIDTDNVTEGSTNVFYTEARFDASLAGKNTANLAEGTNLYYTDARADARIAAADTDDLSEGSTNLYHTSARADARVNLQTGANLDLSSKSTSDLSEGTNQYYTEARVQTKLDNAFAQLQAMLTNLATTTTLTLNLSGDPTPGAAVTTSVTNGGGGGFVAGTAVATTGGTGSSLTVNTTVVNGIITAAAVNAGGSGFLVNETVTVANANAGKVLSLNLASLAGGSNYVTGTALATTGGSGSASLTVDITASAGAITNVTINDGGTGYVVGETITIVQPTGLDGSNPGAGGTVNVATVATDATLQLTDVTTMEIGATVTGATSGTTGVITALAASAITVDTVDGFFKVGEVVSANDVTTLTVQSFA
ncbi:structural protein [Synechococcus phage ACG-2014a]|uniref:Structural protein n=1 Tax=Synechococcus phage ACG-2014a TaxID=1493507 RepID=A0A0E3F5Q1_9CAUD|nr:structural protein [Synechococcus phage ACG-2014a]